MPGSLVRYPGWAVSTVSVENFEILFKDDSFAVNINYNLILLVVNEVTLEKQCIVRNMS